MAEEYISQVKEMIPDESCSSHLPPTAAVSNGNVNMRRYSTGTLDKRGSPGGKAQGQTRYRGNQASSTHDLCKHGKRREDELVIKPWKLVKKKNVDGGGSLVNGETLSLVRKSLVNVCKPEKSLHVVKRDHAGANASEVVKSCDGLRAKRSETKSTITPSDSVAGVKMAKKASVDVKKVSRVSESKSSKEDVLKRDEKMKIDKTVTRNDILEKKVSRINEKKSYKEDFPKSLKSKEKTEIDEPVRCDDVLENTLYVVESSIDEKKVKKKTITSVKSEIQLNSRGSGRKSLNMLSPSSEEVKRSDPRPLRQITSRSKTVLSEKKQSGSPTLVANAKTESKKRIGLKAPPPPGPSMRPGSFKKGKVLEPKTEDSTPAMIKFKKRVVQEPKLISDVNNYKKNLKDKGEGVGKMSYNSGEAKQEKVFLRHRKVEEKKKVWTLFNNMIEETVSKLEEEKKSRVKALVGAFETVISLQDNDKISLQKKKKNIQSKSMSSQVVQG